MDELVDELSGTTLDGDVVNKDFPMKTKANKAVNRTASIINRSKLLVLSDSESDDGGMGGDGCVGGGGNFDKRASKHMRLSKQRSPCGANWRAQRNSSYSKMLAKGKRKRNSATDALMSSVAVANSSVNAFHNNNNNLFAAGPSGLQKERLNKLDSMDVECDQFGDSDSTSSSTDDEQPDSDLSDESPNEWECNFDGDDEQSDFYDSSLGNPPPARLRSRIYCHSRPKMEFKMPTNPSNPFWSVVDLEPHHHPGSASINLWKRRRPLH